MNKKYNILFCLVLMFTGCAPVADGPLFTSAPVPLDSTGVLYVFQKVPATSYSPMVRINDKPFVQLKKKGYSYTYLLPGVYKLSFGENGTTTSVVIRAGQEIFEEFYAYDNKTGVIELTNDQASEQIKNYRYIEPI